jgi:hypothetical protein
MPTLFHKDDMLSREELEKAIYFSELYELSEETANNILAVHVPNSKTA